MRERLAQVFVEQAQKDKDYIMLSGDHGYALFDPIRQHCPDQFVNVGVAEQSLVGYAAGLAKVGMKPVIYGLAAFLPMRVLEQIKLDLCHAKLNVTMIGDGAGLVYSKLGSSHQCCEDIAVMRPLPNVTVYSPCDQYELEACFLQALNEPHPSYIRLGKADRPAVHNQLIANFALQKINHVAEGGVALMATGSMVSIAKSVAIDLGVNAYSVPKISPWDPEWSAQLADYQLIVTLEEHSSHGGLYSAVLEGLAPYDLLLKTKVRSLGTEPKFNEFCGTWEYAMSEHDLHDERIYQRIDHMLKECQ